VRERWIQNGQCTKHGVRPYGRRVGCGSKQLAGNDNVLLIYRQAVVWIDRRPVRMALSVVGTLF
jgi:hypothetical protein